MPPVRIKTYVLDTNVLIHDTQSIFRFEEHNVIIPVEVLEELDNLKSEQNSERGRNARAVNRTLDHLFPTTANMQEGVILPSGGRLRIFTVSSDKFKNKNPRLKLALRDERKKDNLILRTAWAVYENFPAPVIIVSKDTNVRLKARAIGLIAEDYQHDRVEEKDVRGDNTLQIDISPYDIQRFASEGSIEIPSSVKYYQNQYALLNAEGHTMPARLTDAGAVRLHHPDSLRLPSGATFRARNLEQQFLLDALLDPKITMVTVTGVAGTGKTLLSTLSALHQVLNTGTYDKVMISRAIMPLGRDQGYLPGDLKSKMDPWLQPYYDALECLFPTKKVDPKFQEKQKKKVDLDTISQIKKSDACERLLLSGILQIEALTYIRGRSIPRGFVIIDECQNLNCGEIKTIVTRMSQGSKLLLLGDPSQIDCPFLDIYSNGLVHADTKMRGQNFFASVHLTKGERSPLAEAAAHLL